MGSNFWLNLGKTVEHFAVWLKWKKKQLVASDWSRWEWEVGRLIYNCLSIKRNFGGRNCPKKNLLWVEELTLCVVPVLSVPRWEGYRTAFHPSRTKILSGLRTVFVSQNWEAPISRCGMFSSWSPPWASLKSHKMKPPVRWHPPRPLEHGPTGRKKKIQFHGFWVFHQLVFWKCSIWLVTEPSEFFKI